MTYGDDEVAALLQAARDPCDAVLILLGAHAGLRAHECTDLHWADVHLARWDLLVRQALAPLGRQADGYVLPYRTAGSAWRHMWAVCRATNVTPRGVHALRHAAGTRLYARLT